MSIKILLRNKLIDMMLKKENVVFVHHGIIFGHKEK
jgi:hypothetical protein